MTLCGNPVLSLPNGLQMEAAMRALSLHFSIDLYITESNRFADYILPAATFLERQDHAVMRVQSMMRRVLMASPAAVPPPGQARAEPEIFAELARRMGADSPLPMMSLPPQAVAAGIEPGHDAWADIALRLSEHGDHYGARPEGLTVEKLIRDHPDGYALPPVELLATSFDHIAHADGRIHITAEIEDEMERLLAGAGETGADLELIGRRNLKSLNSWLHNAPRLIRSQKPSLLIHPFDARDRGLKDGEPACIRSNAGETIVTIKISDEMMRGVVSYPHGFGHVSPGWPIASAAGGININCLSSTRPEDMERISGSALLDGIAVRVERLPPSANR
jgi:formate dehydrogenase